MIQKDKISIFLLPAGIEKKNVILWFIPVHKFTDLALI